jgi:hypothetical protein
MWGKFVNAQMKMLELLYYIIPPPKSKRRKRRYATKNYCNAM